MMALQRADRLKVPPMVGERYLVPAIQSYLFNSVVYRWWPVIGHKHTDVEHFNFEWPHYHIDPRFLARRHYSDIGPGGVPAVLKRPITNLHVEAGPPKPVLRAMTCTSFVIAYPYQDRAPIIAINKQFAGYQCRAGKRGFVCPHRHIALGSIAPINGVITCPLHGLRVDAVTGVCLGPVTQSRAVGA